MNQLLLAFEAHLGLGPVAASRVLRCAYSTYAQYRSGLRPLPTYHEGHIDALMRHTERELHAIVQERIHVKS